MKTTTTLLIVQFIFTFLQAQESRELQTEITDVTVFGMGAQIHRIGNVDVPEGKTKIKITGLTPAILFEVD